MTNGNKQKKRKELAFMRIPVTPDAHTKLKVYAAERSMTLDEAILNLLKNVKKSNNHE